MNPGEASRQYQLALEHRRAVTAAVDGCVSFDEELAGLDAEVDRARGQVIDAIVASSAKL